MAQWGGCCPGPSRQVSTLTLEALCLLLKSSPIVRLTVLRFSEAKNLS